METNHYNQIKINKTFSVHNLLLPFIVFSIVFVFCSTKGSLAVFAQTNDRNEKKITKETFKNEPIEFVELKSNRKKFKFGEKFNQQDDWLKDFTLGVQNVSGKPITCISIAITFHETNSTGLPITHFINYGIPPNFPKNNNLTSKVLAPNETTQINLSSENYKSLVSFLATRNHNLMELNETHLTIILVYFQDGTKWSAGDIYQPDPNRPGKYIAAEESVKSQL